MSRSLQIEILFVWMKLLIRYYRYYLYFMHWANKISRIIWFSVLLAIKDAPEFLNVFYCFVCFGICSPPVLYLCSLPRAGQTEPGWTPYPILIWSVASLIIQAIFIHRNKMKRSEWQMMKLYCGVDMCRSWLAPSPSILHLLVPRSLLEGREKIRIFCLSPMISLPSWIIFLFWLIIILWPSENQLQAILTTL